MGTATLQERVEVGKINHPIDPPEIRTPKLAMTNIGIILARLDLPDDRRGKLFKEVYIDNPRLSERLTKEVYNIVQEIYLGGITKEVAKKILEEKLREYQTILERNGIYGFEKECLIY